MNRLRHLACKSSLNLYTRGVHNRGGQSSWNTTKMGPSQDQYSAHSPLQISRHGTDELKSKIFFDHPPIPNRLPKFVLLFMFVSCFTTGLYDRLRRRNKQYK